MQPGEIKKLPELVLDIDRTNHSFRFQPQLVAPSANNMSDPVILNNISPNQFRKPPLNNSIIHPINIQTNKSNNFSNHHLTDPNLIDPYMRGGGGGGSGLGPSSLQSHDTYLNWQHSAANSYTPHSSTPPPPSTLPRNNNNNNLATSLLNNQYYDPNLIIPTNQLLNQQHHGLMDSTSQKLNNECKFLFFKVLRQVS
jgi:hypothetical protein